MSDWTVVVPVKSWHLAKSRLDLPPRLRIDIARSMAIDTFATVASTSGVGRMVVVSSHADVQITAKAYGAVVLTDRGLASPDPLNDAIAKARAWAWVHHPLAPFAVVPADLAGLTPELLTEALGCLAGPRAAYVVDAHGTGTTLYAAPTPAQAHPCYGTGSHHRHRASGARAVTDVDPRIRQDVDTRADLTAAHGLGLAPHTRRAVTRLNSPVP